MVKRVVVAGRLLGLVSTVAACGGEEKQFIGWPCDRLTEEEVREAFGRLGPARPAGAGAHRAGPGAP